MPMADDQSLEVVYSSTIENSKMKPSIAVAISVILTLASFACAAQRRSKAESELPTSDSIDRIEAALIPWSFTPMTQQSRESIQRDAMVEITSADAIFIAELLAAIRYSDMRLGASKRSQTFNPNLAIDLWSGSDRTTLLSDGTLLCYEFGTQCILVDRMFRQRFDPLE